MAVQILFGSILEPKITGEKLNMSPILIVVSLYVWGWIWGISGMLLSVPVDDPHPRRRETRRRRRGAGGLTWRQDGFGQLKKAISQTLCQEPRKR